MKKAILCWSGGKDCTLALHQLSDSGEYSVAGILTTITGGYERISMHGVRTSLLEKQADALSLPLEKLTITGNASNEEYEEKLSAILKRHKQNEIHTVAFGDVFLDDLRAYREQNLTKLQMKAVFPLWKKNTADLAHSFIDLGFRAIITCVDTKYLDARFCGREFDESLLSDLPSPIDPCGENGEFHTFVYDGPLFRERISFSRGEIVLRDNRFSFIDIIPA